MKGLETALIALFKALYTQLGAALLVTILSLTTLLYARKIGIKEVLRELWMTLKQDARFRHQGILIFYLMMVCFRTLLCRELWINPISDVIGIWGFYDHEGNLYVEGILNFLLFIPLMICWFSVYPSKSTKIGSLFLSLKLSFLFSLSIELCQLFLKLGTFQLSDIFYNTLGGLCGGIFYVLYMSIKKIIKDKY